MFYAQNGTEFFRISLNILSFAISILTIIGMWKTFEKANEPGWKVLIPVYNNYTLAKISECVRFFIIHLIAGIIFVVFYVIFFLTILGAVITAFGGPVDDSMLSPMFFVSLIGIIVSAIIMFVMNILIAIKTAKVFGKGTLFALGLVFLPFIFYMILGFSNDVQFIGNIKCFEEDY